MKVWKRIIGIALTLALILQCGQGIVIGKAEEELNIPFGSNSNLKVEKFVRESDSRCRFWVYNRGTETFKGNFKIVVDCGESWAPKRVVKTEPATSGIEPNEFLSSVVDVAESKIHKCSVYSYVEDSRISNVNYRTNQYGNGSITFSLASSVSRCSYRLTFLDNEGAVRTKNGVAASSNVNVELKQSEQLNNGTLLSYEITDIYGATEYTAVPTSVTVNSANLPTVDLAPYSGGPYIDPKATVSATDALKYTVNYVDEDGPKTASFTAAGSGDKFKMSDASWYNNNIIITKWTITDVVKFNSAYSWMQLALTADGNSWTVTNTSSNNVTSFEVNGETIPEALGLNQKSTPQSLPSTNNHIIVINLTKANYVSIAAMYPDANAIWFVPTLAQMSDTQIDWAVANNSTDYRVNSYNISLHYRINGQDRWETLTQSKAVEAQGTYSDSLPVSVTGGFEFVELTIQNVSYTKDIDPNLEHKDYSGPTVGTSSLNYKTYVTWSLVNFGTYALRADGGTGPIEWRVLEYDEASDKIVLMANKALFSMAYEPTMFGSDWQNSALRKYLGNDTVPDDSTFIMTAFNEAQRDAICPVVLDNSGSGSSHSVGGAATTDKVYVLSVAEINNPKYGLYGGDATNSVVETRQFGATEATLANTNLTKKTYAGETFVNYYLRTPGYYQYDVAGVAPSGILNASGWRTYTKTAAVCPVVTLSLGAAKAAGLTWKGSVYKQVASGYNTAAAKSVKATPTKKLNKLSIGDTTTVNNVTYKVTKTTNKAKTVAVVGIKKSAKKVVIPSTIKAKGATYKVTSIDANAFKSAKNNIKTITIKSKNIKTMNKKAFNGLTKKTTVKISKAQYKKYKKLIKNDKVTVKKN